MDADLLKQITPLLAKLHHDLIAANDQINSNAIYMLQEDLKRSEFIDPSAAPDGYINRANNIVFLYLNNNFADAAVILYQMLIEKTLEHSKSTGIRRYLGALYANKGVAHAIQGNLDQAVVEFLRAFEEDKITYGNTKDRSFAMITLLPEYFIKPLQGEILMLARNVKPELEIADIERLCVFLDDLAYAFIAYIRQYIVHNEAIKVAENFYSKLQILNSFRNLCAMFEVELKIKSGTPEDELLSLITNLYKYEVWWKDFIRAKDSVKGTRKSPRSINDELRDSFAINALDEATIFWKSLLITYITRNHTIHQMDINTDLIDRHSVLTISHILYAMIKAAL